MPRLTVLEGQSFEYSNQVYTNLTLAYAEKLEELNRCGLRCVTGCKVGTSPQELYRETDELSLEERRKKSRMNKLYEVLKEDRSCRLNRGMIQTVGERNPHARRRVNDLTQLIYHRTDVPKLLAKQYTGME